jgi:uncharacterized protein (TIGR00255 family)
MVRSMTGFGRAEVITDEYRIAVEIKAVNHRYLDLSVKVPRKLNFMEASIRSLLKEYIQRGKVDVFITCDPTADARVSLRFNESLAKAYIGYFEQMSRQFNIENDVTVSRLSALPEIFTMEEESDDEEHLLDLIAPVVREAAQKLVDARSREGENLRRDLLGKLDGMEKEVDLIIERSPKIVEEYRSRLLDKVRELLGSTQVDESLIATEVTAYADRICTDEEVVRLKSHIDATRNELTKGGSVGRKLDFIAQEMNREANTILSKANDKEVSDAAITLKTEIEKVREQIQNLE